MKICFCCYVFFAFLCVAVADAASYFLFDCIAFLLTLLATLETYERILVGYNRYDVPSTKYIIPFSFEQEHLLLKGGTAINLSVFNMPRLSVDIDMDYTPNNAKEDMLVARERITTLIKEYMETEGYQLSKGSRFTHSLDAFYYQYQNTGGNRDMIKIELK